MPIVLFLKRLGHTGLHSTKMRPFRGGQHVFNELCLEHCISQIKILKIKTKKRSNAKMDVNDLRVMDAADGILYLLHYFESNIYLTWVSYRFLHGSFDLHRC